MKFDIRSALDTMAQVATGQFAGQMQGMLQAQEQNNRQFNQALNVVEMQNQQQHREQQMRGDYLGLLGKQWETFSPEGQGAILSGADEYLRTGQVTNKYQAPAPQHPFPAPMGQALDAVAGMGVVPGMMPGMGQALEEEMRPETPAMAKTPFGDIPIAGVGKKDIAALTKRHGQITQILSKAPPGHPAASTASALLSGVNLNPTTVQELRETNRALSQVTSLMPGIASAPAYAKLGRDSFVNDLNDLAQSRPEEFLVNAPGILSRFDEASGRGEKYPPRLEPYRDRILAMQQKYEAGDQAGALKDAAELRAEMRIVGKASQGERNQALNLFMKAIDKMPLEALKDPNALAAIAKDVPFLQGEDGDVLTHFAKGAANKVLEGIKEKLLKVDDKTPLPSIEQLVNDYNRYGDFVGEPIKLTVKAFARQSKLATAELAKREAAAKKAASDASIAGKKDKDYKEDRELSRREAETRIRKMETEIDEKRKKGGGKVDNSTIGGLQRKAAASKAAFDRYFKDRKVNVFFRDSGFDPATETKPQSEQEAIAIQLYRQAAQDDAHYRAAMKDAGKGKYTAPPPPRPKYTPPPAKPAAPEPESPIQKGVKTLKRGATDIINRFTGKPKKQTPGQKAVGKQMQQLQRGDHLKKPVKKSGKYTPGMYRNMSDAELRRRMAEKLAGKN